MKWFGDFAVGFFTRHLGAKLLALLLSLGLFGFVQASLTGTREVSRLDLVCSLADELRSDYILLTERFVISGLTMTGERAKVDPLARLYRGTSIRLPIDSRILQAYGRPGADGRIIPIDAALFRDEVLFGKDITVGGLPGDAAILVNTLENRSARVEVAPALQQMGHFEYEGKFSFTLNVQAVQLRGPKSAFLTNDVRIVVNVPNIEDRITQQPVPGDSGTLRLAGVADIQWTAGGIRPELVHLLRITADKLGPDPLTAKEFQQRVVASAQLTKKKVVHTLSTVPILIRYPVPKKYDLADYDALPPFTNADLSRGWIAKLDVRLPAALTAPGNEEFLESLVVVVDVDAAEENLDRLEVPFHLDLKGKRQPEYFEKLRQVAIDMAETVANFDKKR